MPAVQIVFDCSHPHTLARFWSGAMGLEIEDHHELVEQMLEQGHASDDDTVVVDGRRAWKEAAACHDPEGGQPRLLFQKVGEPKTVKNRVHIDIHVGPEKRADKVDEVVGLGAARLWEGRQGPFAWTTLADPEGNEFCVS